MHHAAQQIYQAQMLVQEAYHFTHAYNETSTNEKLGSMSKALLICINREQATKNHWSSLLISR